MPENLIEHFEDTLHRCESEALRDATRQAMEGTKVYREDFRAQQPLMPRYERAHHGGGYHHLCGGCPLRESIRRGCAELCQSGGPPAVA